MRYFLIILLLFVNFSSAVEFGEYSFNKYVGINQQLQNQRASALRRQRQYNQIPTRNIKYPTSYNKYPNITRGQQYGLSARQRYSPRYYNSL